MASETAKKTAKEMVNKPSHYNLKGGKQVIDFIEEFGMGPTFCLTNFLKYMARKGKKFIDKTEEDFNKAQWYRNRLIEETKLPPYAVDAMLNALLAEMGVG